MLTYPQQIREWGKTARAKDWLVGIFLLGWAVILLWPLAVHPDHGPMPAVAQDTDFLITHLPIARYVHESITRDGILPLWNASLNSGQPFASDPLSGYWYLPNWLTFWQPQPWMFSLLFGLHLLWSGLGMYFLLKREGVRPLAAGFAGAVWMAAPKTIGYIGGGQVSMVYALAWTPWLLMAFRQAACSLKYRQAILAGGCLAVVFLADVRWGFYSGLLALVYALVGAKLQSKQFLQAARCAGSGLAAFGVLTAGLTLPMLEFMGLSRRSALSMDDMGAFSVRPEVLLGVIAPQFGMIYEYVVYLGWVTLILAVIGLVRRRWFWGGSLLGAALFSLGTSFFLFPLAVNLLPGLGWLRVPGRAWFIVSFCAAALAGWGLDALFSRPAPAWAMKWISPLVFGTATLSVLSGVGVIFFIRIDPFPTGLAVLLLVPPLTLGLMALVWKSNLSRTILAAGLFLLAAVDLLVYDSSQLTSRALPDSEVTRWLEAQPGLFRVYSPDGSLTLPNRLQMANGVDPLHLNAYASYMEQASRIPSSGYSVSLPDIYIDANTPPETAAAAAHPETDLLGILNVRYLAARFPLQAPGLELVQQFSGTSIYQNTFDRGRAWLENGSVSVLAWSPGKIRLESDGPAGRLTISEIMAPGWQAWVDGQPTAVNLTHELLLGVDLAAGKHQTVIEYRPASVIAGSAAAGTGWLAFLIYFLTTWRVSFDAASLHRMKLAKIIWCSRQRLIPTVARLLQVARRLLSTAFPERQIFAKNYSIPQKMLLLAGMTFVFYIPGLLLTPGGFIGFDWYSFFGIGRIAPFYPPWTGAVVSVLNWPLLVGLGLAAFSLAALQRSVHPLSLAAAFFCLPVLWTIFLGQLEGLVILGLVGLPWLAPLALLKPQVSIFAFGAKKQYLAALLVVLALSTMIYGPWWLRMLNAESYYAEGRYVQNIGLGWWGLPVFLATVWFSRGDIDMLMLSGCFITPHLIPYNLMPVVPAISRLRPLTALVGLGLSWLPIITANSQGNWGWWTGWLFPIWVWANLAAQRYPQWRK